MSSPIGSDAHSRCHKCYVTEEHVSHGCWALSSTHKRLPHPQPPPSFCHQSALRKGCGTEEGSAQWPSPAVQFYTAQECQAVSPKASSKTLVNTENLLNAENPVDVESTVDSRIQRTGVAHPTDASTDVQHQAEAPLHPSSHWENLGVITSAEANRDSTTKKQSCL